MANALKTLAVLLSVLSAVSVAQEYGDGLPTVTIEPFRWTMEVGESTTLECTFSGAYTNSTTWFYPDNVTEVSSEFNSSRIWADDEGVLHVTDGQVNDTGSYLCVVTVDTDVVAATTESPTTDENRTDISEKGGRNVSAAAAFYDAESYNATVYLHVYVMPTYFTEGMIILGINVGLLLVFLAFLAQSMASERKRMKLYGRK